MSERNRTILGLLGLAGAYFMLMLGEAAMAGLSAVMTVGVLWPLAVGERSGTRVSRGAETKVLVIALVLGGVMIAIWLSMLPFGLLAVMAFALTFGRAAYRAVVDALPPLAPARKGYPML